MEKALKPEKEAALMSGAALTTSASTRSKKKQSSRPALNRTPERRCLPPTGAVVWIGPLSKKQTGKSQSTGKESLPGNLPQGQLRMENVGSASALTGSDFEFTLPARPQVPMPTT